VVSTSATASPRLKPAAEKAPLQDYYIDCRDSMEKKFDGTRGKK
jgi:homogentisate 1,2-dioxygenase